MMDMDNDDIKNDPCVKDFLRSGDLRKSTKASYTLRIKYYANFIGKTPTELIEEAEEEEESGIKPRNRKIRGYILDFVEYMKNQNKAHYTIKSNLETIKTFYNIFDIDTPRVKLKKSNMANLTWEAIPEVKHLKEALKSANLRDKAIILLMFSSGMGLSEVRFLNYANFIDAMDEYLDLDGGDELNLNKISKQLKNSKTAIGTWRIERYKTGMPYITFNSPESTYAIVDYLLYRKNNNKPIKDIFDPLFVSHFNNRISKSSFLGAFQRINDKANFGMAKNRKRRFLTSHTLRKLFTTTLYNHGVDKLAVDWFLGHRINPVTEAYFKSNVKDLKARYISVVQHLTLSGVKVKTVTTKEYDNLLRDSNEKENRIREMEKKLEEMAIKIESRDQLLDDILGNENVLKEIRMRKFNKN